MTDFHHVEFEQLRGELALQPLPAHSRQLVDLLLKGECVGPELCDSSMDAAVARFAELSLVSDEVSCPRVGRFNTGNFAPTWLFTTIVDRGQLDTLLEAAH